MKKYFAFLGLLAVLVLTACASRDLAKRNLAGVKTEVAVLEKVDPSHEIRNAEAVETATQLYEATAPLEQVVHLGVSDDLAQQNLSNVHEIVADIQAAGAADPDRDGAVVRVASQLADDVRASNVAIGAARAVWPTSDILAIIGALGAVFTTAKTAQRTWKARKKPPAAAAPAAPAA